MQAWTGRRPAGVLLALGVTAAAAAPGVAQAQGVRQTQAVPAEWVREEPPRALLFLVDASAAMRDPGPEGRPRWDAVREAVAATAGVLPDAAPVGLRVAGSEPLAAPPGCADTRPLVPVAPLDRGALAGALLPVVPDGPASTAEALRVAVDDLPATTEATVVLLAGRTGGCLPAETCGAARELVDRGMGLRVVAVGVSPDPATADELRCVAEATGGAAHFPDSAADLTATLTRAAMRGLSPLTPAPVQPVAGQGEGPVALGPGTHSDVLRPGRTRRYAVELAAGEDLLATVTAQAPPAVAERLVLRVVAGDPEPADGTGPTAGVAPRDAAESLLGLAPQSLHVRTGLAAPAAVEATAAGTAGAGSGAPGLGVPPEPAASRPVPLEVTLEQFGVGPLPAVDVPVLLDVDVVGTLVVVEAPAPVVRPAAPAPAPEPVVVTRDRVPVWVWGLVAALAWAVVALAVVLAGFGTGAPPRPAPRARPAR